MLQISSVSIFEQTSAQELFAQKASPLTGLADPEFNNLFKMNHI
jgi:hypothetical protein